MDNDAMNAGTPGNDAAEANITPQDTGLSEGTLDADGMAELLGDDFSTDARLADAEDAPPVDNEDAEAAEGDEAPPVEGSEEEPGEEEAPALSEKEAELLRREQELNERETQQNQAAIDQARESGDLFFGRPKAVLSAFGDPEKPFVDRDNPQNSDMSAHVAVTALTWSNQAREDLGSMKAKLEETIKAGGQEGASLDAILAVVDEHVEAIVAGQQRGIVETLTRVSLETAERAVKGAEAASQKQTSEQTINQQWQDAWKPVFEALGDGESIPEEDLKEATQTLNTLLSAGYQPERAIKTAMGAYAQGIKTGKAAAANQQLKAGTDQAAERTHQGSGRTPDRGGKAGSTDPSRYGMDEFEKYAAAVMGG